MRRKSRKRQWKGSLPTSSEIIGGLATLLEWKPESGPRDRTWRKFTRGQHISAEMRDAILLELGRTLARGLGEERTPDGQVLSREAAAEAIRTIVQGYASWWDSLCSQLEEAIATEPTEFIDSIALRLVVVDLAVRCGAILASEGVHWEPMKLEGLDTEKWFLPVLLREVLRHFDITRAALGQAIGVTKEAVDQWLAADAVISEKVVDEIAVVLARKAGTERAQVSGVLRLERLLTLVFKALRDRVGKETANELVGGLLRLTQVSLGTLNAQLQELDGRERDAALWHVLILGSESWLGRTVRDAMLKQEQDDIWRGAILLPRTLFDGWTPGFERPG